MSESSLDGDCSTTGRRSRGYRKYNLCRAPSQVAQEFNTVTVDGSHGFCSDWNKRVLYCGSRAYGTLLFSYLLPFALPRQTFRATWEGIRLCHCVNHCVTSHVLTRLSLFRGITVELIAISNRIRPDCCLAAPMSV